MNPTTRVFRVTVRGRFDALSDQQRSSLKASASEHDIFLSAFTEEGTFTYDQRIDFFNLRYEIRLPDEGIGLDTVAQDRALADAGSFLRTLRLPHRALTARVMDMTAMTERQG